MSQALDSNNNVCRHTFLPSTFCNMNNGPCIENTVITRVHRVICFLQIAMREEMKPTSVLLHPELPLLVLLVKQTEVQSHTVKKFIWWIQRNGLNAFLSSVPRKQIWPREIY